MNELFPSLPQTLSPRLAWMQRHGICTWHKPDATPPWAAFIPEVKGRFGLQPDTSETIEIWTPVWDDGTRSQEGDTEGEALTALAKTAGLKFWNEE